MNEPINNAELIRYLDGELTAVDKAAIECITRGDCAAE